MGSKLTWTVKRQAIIIGSFLGVVALLLFFLLTVVFVSEPEEAPVDLGQELQKPMVLWNVAFPVSEDFHGAVGRFVNVESGYHANKANYRLTFYDQSGEVIGTRDGETFFDAGESFYIFERNLRFSETPEWTGLTWESIDWEEGRRAGAREGYDFSISNVKMERDLSTPRLEGRVVNTGAIDIPSVEAVALIRDEYDNVVSASRVVLGLIPYNGDTRLSLSWPERFRFLNSICSPALETRVVLLDNTDDDIGSVSDVMESFESDIDEGFLWSLKLFIDSEEIDTEEILEGIVREAHAIRYRDAPLFVFAFSEEIDRELVAKIEGALETYDFVKTLQMNRDNFGYLPSDLSKLYNIFDANCAQEPERIEVHGRIVD